MPALDPDMFDRLCRARARLRDTGDPVSVAEVAREIAVSPFHFIRRFEQVFGATPNRFRTAWRLERARRLLAAGELSVTGVCLEVGYSSVGSFSARFSRAFGTTPSAFRRRARTLVQVPGIPPPALVPGCLSLMGSLGSAEFRNPGEAPGPAPRQDLRPIETHEPSP